MQLKQNTVDNIIPFVGKASRGSNPLDQVWGICHALQDSQILSIIAMLQGLLEAREQERAPKEESSALGGDGKTRSPRGWYEQKKINGCGPYWWFRWREGKKKKQVYLGKTKGGEA